MPTSSAVCIVGGGSPDPRPTPWSASQATFASPTAPLPYHVGRTERHHSGMAAAEQAAVIDARPAFAEALRANQSMVFSIAYHFLRDRGSAEEIAGRVPA